MLFRSRGTFSPARAWRPAVVARLARTLGSAGNILRQFSAVSACRCELNSHNEAEPRALSQSQLRARLQAPVEAVREVQAPMPRPFTDTLQCIGSQCRLRASRQVQARGAVAAIVFARCMGLLPGPLPLGDRAPAAFAASWLFGSRRQALTLLAHCTALPALPNVRAKRTTTAGRQARAGENVPRTAGRARVARRWGSA